MTDRIDLGSGREFSIEICCHLTSIAHIARTTLPSGMARTERSSFRLHVAVTRLTGLVDDARYEAFGLPLPHDRV